MTLSIPSQQSRFTLDKVVPWGRSFDEYQRMFALTETDLGLKIVGCGDGPANFNAEAARRGWTVISCDPIYRYDVDQLQERIAATYEQILGQTRRNATEFVWNVIRSVEELGQVRMAAMNDFLDDYPAGRAHGRYIDAELPHLPFSDLSFDLALCSHFLFLYTTQLGDSFHRRVIREMCRVATEVRIFPLLALGAVPSPLVEPMAAEFGGQGFNVSIEDVPYEFQRGGNKMIKTMFVSDRERAASCPWRDSLLPKAAASCRTPNGGRNDRHESRSFDATTNVARHADSI